LIDLMRRSMCFTLIELMIVILIIAILIGVAIPVYLAANTNAEKRTCQANLRTIDGAINTYIADAAVYPPTIGQMTSGCYRVLKDQDICPTNDIPYSLTIVPNSRPLVLCPDSITGHSI